MKRLLPRSLVGQVALLIALALLVAQAINFALLLNEGQRARLAQTESPALSRLAAAVNLVAEAEPDDRRDLVRAMSGGGARFTISGRSLVERRGLARDPGLEARIAASLAEGGITSPRVRAGEGVPRRQAAEGGLQRRLLLVSLRLADGQWLNGRFVVRKRDGGFAWRLLLATLALYAIVLGAVLLATRRLAKPLQEITDAAEAFQGRDPGYPLTPRGPEDLKRLAEAFNAMRARLTASLAEKDRMIGAIGHDLRTPLASLRIRAESVPDDAERERMAATIESLDQTLDDILALARAGRPGEAPRAVDAAALVEAAVEEFRDTGQPVDFTGPDRLVATLRPTSIRRAVRNLIDNALKYGGSAQVSVAARQGHLDISIADSGPGIPEAELACVTDPFYRLEPSRNRSTGGTGLGLALARTIAEAEGGRLELANRPEGGLSARLILPVRPAPGR